MNRQLEILHKIFELELAPPFNFVNTEYVLWAVPINNKHSQQIGWIRFANQSINFEPEKVYSILKKVKQIFKLEELSADEISIIEKQLIIWFRDKFPVSI